MDYAPLDCKIRINRGHRTRCEPQWRWAVEPNHFKDFDLWYVFAGDGCIEWDDGISDKLFFGCTLLLRPWQGFKVSHNPQNPIGVSVVHFDFLKKGKVVIPAESQLPPRYQCIENLSLINDLLVTVLEKHHAEDPLNRQEAHHYLHGLLLEMCRHSQKEALPRLLLEQQQRLRPILAEIQENPSRHYRVEEIAKRVSWAPDYLTRVFKNVLGITPSEFCIQVRINRARQLLQETTFSISEIAEMLGYPDIYSFSRQFREKTGTSPKAFRR